MSIRQNRIPIATLEAIDEICLEFERQWQSDGAPRIEPMIDGGLGEAGRRVLLAELLALDVDYRRKAGESPGIEEYIERFPNDVEAINNVFDETLATGKLFEPPSLKRVSELFPTLEISDFLGAGGMGAVYKARQVGLNRWVALKILPEELGMDAKFALRFTREARVLAKLNHKNIVSVFEFGNVGDTYYFLMEYVDGPTLRDVVNAGQLAPEHALEVVPQLCDALQYAHDATVVHRDVKPENILLSKGGEVKIADFGLSRILSDESQDAALTGTHQVMGTPRYMAPEQMEGARRADHRSDIYSLGVVFYEMLTGELPIGRFAAPSKKVEIDVRLDEVVFRALEKEPARRYQSASHIKTDVQAIALSSDDADSKSNRGRTEEAATEDGLQQQELAARLLISRRKLMGRVERAMAPLFRWQVVQILVGVAIIGLGAQCWARNIGVAHRVVCGAILHVYGIVVIAAAASVVKRIKSTDYSQRVKDVRSAIQRVRSAYLRMAPVAGFPWWIMWLPASVAFGFDEVLHPNCLYVSVFVGIVGGGISIWLFYAALRTDGDKWHVRLSGSAIGAAMGELDEIERAQIQ